MKKMILITYIFSLFLACKKEGDIPNPIPPSINPEFIKGKWIEQEPEDRIAYAGSNHIFEFTDSFFLLKRYYWTDEISTEDKCQNSYTAYFKGAVRIDPEKLQFNGLATDETYELIAPECNRYAEFKVTFSYEIESENVIILNPEQEVYKQIRLER